MQAYKASPGYVFRAAFAIERVILPGIVVLAIFASARGQEAAWQGPDRPVYVVTQNHYAEGPEGKTAKFGDLIAIEIFNPEARTAEENPVYTVGERIALFVGGQKQGDVRIRRVVPLQCDSSAALVSTGASFHLPKNAMALASNAKKIRSHTNNQRQPNEAERKNVEQLAINEFRKHGVLAASAKNIKFDQLILTKVDGSESAFLIGSLSVEAKGVGHEVFLIAKIEGSEATTELARYHETTDLEDGKDSENVRFVDQLDLDGDGTDEIAVEVTGYESEGFGIYRRHNSTWSQVHLGGKGGC